MTKSLTNELDLYLHIKSTDVKLFGLNGAAILSVIKAGDTWRLETNRRNKKANDVAEMHGDRRWLPEDVSLGFTNQDFIERTFGMCGRNGVVEAIKTLLAQGVISQHANPNKKYSSDKGRYFRFHQDIYTVLVNRLKNNEVIEVIDESQDVSDEITSFVELSTGETRQVVECSDHLNLNDAPFKNKRQEEENRLKINVSYPKINAPRLNSVSHIRNSNNINKNIINHSINAHTREDFIFDEKTNNLTETETEPTKLDATQSIIDALIKNGLPAHKFYPDCIAAIQRLQTQGAIVSHFLEAFDQAAMVTQGKGFGVNYLIKVVEGLLSKSQKNTNPTLQGGFKNVPRPNTKPSRSQKEYVYENDLKNAESWAGDLI